MSSYDDWKAREPDSLDPGRHRDADFGDDDTPSVCDLPSCGEPVRVTFAGVGQFCSRDHLERDEL
jgi:hypothetical protein